MTRRTLICAVLAAAAAATPATGLTTVGGSREIAAETAAPGPGSGLAVMAPSTAWDPGSRRFLVTWSRSGDGGPAVTRGRFVDVAGAPLGPAFDIAGSGGGALAHDPVTGGFGLVVGGELLRLDRDGRVVGRHRFSNPGGPNTVGPEWGEPALAVDGRTGGFLVAWLYAPQPGERKVMVSAIPPGAGAEVTTRPAAQPFGGPVPERSAHPSLAWNPADGGFVIAWESEAGLRTRRLAPDGAPDGEAVPVVTADAPSAPVIVPAPAAAGFLLAWTAAGPGPEGQRDVLVRRLGIDGTAAGAPRRAMHVTSADGRRGVASAVSAATADAAGQALLVADVDRLGDGAPSDGPNAFGTAVTEDAATAGPATLQLTGDDPAVPFGDTRSAVAHAPAANRYLLAWTVARRVQPQWFRVSVRIVEGGPVAPVAGSGAVCRRPPAPVTAGTGGRVTRTVRQARITLRTARAALRRAEAAAAWLDGGVQARDLCRGGIGVGAFRAGTLPGHASEAGGRAEPDPRPVRIAPPAPEPRRIRLDAGRLALDQETARRALRLVAALERRLDAGLTGGDVADGSVGAEHLTPGFRPLLIPEGPVDAATVVPLAVAAAPTTRIRATLAQMRINQRIARAALLRADALIRRLEDGIGPHEIRDGTLTAADLAPDLRPPGAP